VNPRNAVGVYSVWNSFSDVKDVFDLKGRAGKLASDEYQDLVRLGLNLVDGEQERQYPFVAIQAHASDFERFCSDNAEALGKLFTGDYESEDPNRLKGYISDNLSRRKYERLLIRWTDALAVYSDETDKKQYENSLFRAVQIFELCVLVRTLFRKISQKADNLQQKVSMFVPRPWAVKEIMNSLAAAEETF